MLELRKFVAPEFIFGAGSLSLAGQYARNFGGKKVMVVSDRGIIEVGCCALVVANLEAEGIDCRIFSEVSQNPRVDEVMAGAEFYADNNCDVIVAVGGGSVIDCAKGIGIVATNNRNITEFEGIDKVPIPGTSPYMYSNYRRNIRRRLAVRYHFQSTATLQDGNYQQDNGSRRCPDRS